MIPPLTVPEGERSVFDFFIGLAFVIMVIGPAILASIQKTRSRDSDL